MPSCHYLISGKVQGVGYRAFTQRIARQLHLTGWTRNLKDQRVEILATGTQQGLEDFEKILRQGPTHATVEKVEAKSIEKVDANLEFIIIADGETTWL